MSYIISTPASCRRNRNAKEINMQAHEILHIARNSTDGMTRAEAVAVETNQDWANEATAYTFADGSVLVASGPQLNAYNSQADYDDEKDAA